MIGTVVLPGPEILVAFGVHVPVLSAIFGLGGIVLGHLIAPMPAAPLGWRRTVGVISAGMMTSLAITIATGQRPLVVLGWSIGIGFSGVSLFATLGSQVASGAKSAMDAIIDQIVGRIAARKDGK